MTLIASSDCKLQFRAAACPEKPTDFITPMTHDLIKQVLDTIEAKVISVVITDLKDNTYFAKIHLTYRDAEITVDSRPSDAIALALKAESPIFVANDVIQKHSSEELDRWLENLRPEDFGQHDA